MHQRYLFWPFPGLIKTDPGKSLRSSSSQPTSSKTKNWASSGGKAPNRGEGNQGQRRDSFSQKTENTLQYQRSIIFRAVSRTCASPSRDGGVSGSTAGAARSGAQLIKSNHLRLQFVRFGWLFIGIYDRFYKRRAGRAQGRLDRRPDFVRAFAMKSVGAASTSESDKIYRRKRAAILWISDFFSFEFHFGKTVIL